jgi:1,4-dihydroxy-2-naphthoate octaprenyltransferase
MNQELRNTLKLLRIPFSFFLMPVFWLALSQAENINWVNVVVCFVVLHLCIYPASNGYNSYMDQDETSIGGLEHPPKPTNQLFYVALLLDIFGLTLAYLVGLSFLLCVLGYVVASRAYSFKGIRLKKYPILGFLTVVIFQGGFTFWIVYSAVGNNGFNISLVPILLACSFLIGGVYPLTQVYQHDADKASGDITISYMLGIKGTFVFAAIMFVVANGLFFVHFYSLEKVLYFFVIQLCLIPVTSFFFTWFKGVLKNPSEANFKNTMRMNLIASVCMNLCFIVLLCLKTIQ